MGTPEEQPILQTARATFVARRALPMRTRPFCFTLTCYAVPVPPCC
uniref:Alternative protein SLC44A5 n=1 Tax=Homo sapiens TaxID=9606 RepID=L8EBE8_HUMAN|nr:alternative protein SLC44A5 [Homo sapiens]